MIKGYIAFVERLLQQFNRSSYLRNRFCGAQERERAAAGLAFFVAVHELLHLGPSDVAIDGWLRDGFSGGFLGTFGGRLRDDCGTDIGVSLTSLVYWSGPAYGGWRDDWRLTALLSVTGPWRSVARRC